MLEDLSKAAAFIRGQELCRRQKPDIVTERERTVARLLSHFLGVFGMDCRTVPLIDELPMFDQHPLKHALIVTPAATISGYSFSKVLRAGCVYISHPDKPLQGVSYHVVVEEFKEKPKGPLVLMIADDGDHVVNRYGDKLRFRQLEGGAAMLRLMMEGVDPNDKQRFWDRYMEQLGKASSPYEKMKLLTVGLNA
ncbi:hypothetical protein HYU95_01925 [Candidatus Daviesbacteria bacterium]|nr:hypothetical protein [Candidatus Daviesbacteria bacterium]